MNGSRFLSLSGLAWAAAALATLATCSCAAPVVATHEHARLSGPQWAPPMAPENMAMPAAAAWDHAAPVGRPLESLAAATWAATQVPPSEQPRSADEYLRDGGDRGPQVHVDAAGNTSGLGVEDTVLHYDDGTGERQVVEANRLAIYSPRFGAVRSVSEVEAYQNTRAGEGMLGAQGASQELAGAAASLERQSVGAAGVRSRLRASGLGSRVEPGAVVGDRGLEATQGTVSVEAAQGAQHVDRVGQTLGPETELTVAAAQVWTAEQFPQAIVTPEAASEAVSDVQAQAVHSNQPQRPQVGRVQLIKQASTGDAVAGEEIEFRILYENVGRAPVHDVVIVDNLTPRLEYVDGTWNKADIGFAAMEQPGGSTILRWRLHQPLGAGEKGEIRFKARVR